MYLFLKRTIQQSIYNLYYLEFIQNKISFFSLEKQLIFIRFQRVCDAFQRENVYL